MGEKSLIFVVAGPEGYGVRRVWDLIFRTVVNASFNVTIAVLDRSYMEAWRADYPGASVVAPPYSWSATGLGKLGLRKYLDILKRGMSQLRLARWLFSVQLGCSASAIILQGPIESMLCGIVARRASIPALWFVPNAISDTKLLDFNRRIYRFLFRHANVVPISNSRFTDSTFGPSNFERYVVHLGVDTERFAPAKQSGAIRSKFGIPETAIVIGVFARMTPSKGQKRLLRAVARIKRDMHVLLCGGPLEGPYYDALLAEISAQDLGDRVHFAGMQNDLVPYYAACDIAGNFLSYPEGFGLTVIEAMACGKPVLAHAAGGPSETIIDGETGWLIPACDVDSIVAGLERALLEQSRWIELGRAGRTRAEAEFSIERFEDGVRQVVEKKLLGIEMRTEPKLNIRN